ncbi:archaetidylserine decarboxylase [Marinobacter fonticola]|uniref:archaetidylserine decarboxylase n=1 Tax=Marinobacter fonticola TaxID=2603215 RepID=UPI0011E6A1B2|nr:archaetidylserine decarboxylase [Marinobacter fonticola]
MRDKLFVMSQYLLPQQGLSQWLGRLADDDRFPKVKNHVAQWFIKRYGVDMSEAADADLASYPTFNAFFTRPLKPGMRPVDEDPDRVTSPVDGAISQLGQIDEGRIFQAKGQDYSLLELVGGDEQKAKPYVDGEFATIYLAPKDYHRIHMPLAGTLKDMTYVPGRLFSVNPVTAANVPRLFARNERVIINFDTEWGPMCMVLVGAMIVGSVETTWAGVVAPGRDINTIDYSQEAPIHFEKGDEMGRFRLGSTVILLFPKGRMDWTSELRAETVLRLGRAIGTRTKNTK